MRVLLVKNTNNGGGGCFKDGDVDMMGRHQWCMWAEKMLLVGHQQRRYSPMLTSGKHAMISHKSLSSREIVIEEM